MAAEDVAQQRAQPAGELVDEVRRAPWSSGATPATTERSSATRCAMRSVTCARDSGSAQSAATRPARRPVCGPSGSSSARSASRMSVSASDGAGGRWPARSAPAPRPARRCAACGGRSASRNARSSSSCWAGTTQTPRALGAGRRSRTAATALPPVRVHAVRASTMPAASYRRSAVSRRRSRTCAWRSGASSPGAASQRQAGEHDLMARPRRSRRASAGAPSQRVGAHQRQAVAERRSRRTSAPGPGSARRPRSARGPP